MVALCLEMLLLFFIQITSPAPQLHPEINDQFETVTSNTTTTTYNKSTTLPSTINTEISEVSVENNEILDENLKAVSIKPETDIVNVNRSVITNIYTIIKAPITKLIEIPKVNAVLRNIGTCVVNGVMEIVSFYLPAPFIPLLASAAGMIIPFEPVVMLRRRMPVTSYRRAINTAVNSFMNTFDAYKFANNDEDPYMTGRFNRRFMNGAPIPTTTKNDDTENI